MSKAVTAPKTGPAVNYDSEGLDENEANLEQQVAEGKSEQEIQLSQSGEIISKANQDEEDDNLEVQESEDQTVGQALTENLEMNSANQAGNLGHDEFCHDLSPEEQKQIIDITCFDVVIHNDIFGPEYADNRPNYQRILLRCPQGCNTKGDTKLFGVGIHPQESGICKAAILDRSIPVIGGIFGVQITMGLSEYEKSEETEFLLDAESFQNSLKSFSTFKVCNLDMIEQQIRIVDFEGHLASHGRLEVRLNGVWGSICQKGVDHSAVRQVCREMKFKDGRILNVQGGVEFNEYCLSYKGENYCGPEGTPQHFKSVICKNGETDFLNCQKELASLDATCSHKEDLIMECINDDLDNPIPPPEGSLRLMGHDNSPSQTGIGRLEYYKNKWGSVCNTLTDDKTADIACRQMGYQRGVLIGNPGQNAVCTDYKEKNYCATVDYQISVKDLVCDGDELNMINCDSETDASKCNHDQDTMIQCFGVEFADPTGFSQKQAAIQDPETPKRTLYALVPKIKLDCQSKGTQADYRGDKASIYLIECPAGCIQEDGTVWGTGILIINQIIIYIDSQQYQIY